jgi:hypothetical protein
MNTLVFREIRWFLTGPVPLEAWTWFDGLPGKSIKQSYPRKDIYLVIPDRDDLGLKAREGRLEIKTRNSQGKYSQLSDGKIGGIAEDWQKHTWDYSAPIGDISTPFEEGLRVRIVKSRAQRKYAVQDERVVPVAMDDRPERAFILELTELFSQAVDQKGKQTSPQRHWTVGCEAIADRKLIEQTFETGTNELLKAYTEPLLQKEDSYGYPKFSMLIAAELKALA